MVGDYFKSGTSVLEFTDDATDLIGWLRSKTLLLALLRAAHMEATGVTKAVIRAVLTRWTSHFLAYRRLLELQPSLVAIVYADEAREPSQRKIIIGDAKAKAKSRSMIAIIKNPLFWHAITR